MSSLQGFIKKSGHFDILDTRSLWKLFCFC